MRPLGPSHAYTEVSNYVGNIIMMLMMMKKVLSQSVGAQRFQDPRIVKGFGFKSWCQ